MVKLKIVAGVPRSGTSLMMDLLRQALGEDRIIGSKWPNEPPPFEQGENETDAHWELRKYNETQTERYAKSVETFRETCDMNPNGFWEDRRFTVRGLPGHAPGLKVVQDLLDSGKDVVKVVSSGLGQSSPAQVDRIIYMLRHPRAVAKSHEKLRGQFGPTGNPIREGREVVKHTPAAFVHSTRIAAEWLQMTGIPYLLVDFDDLIETPVATIAKVQAFLGEGDFSEAIKIVNPTLRRSYPQDVGNALWECAEAIYEAMGRGDLQGVIKIAIPEVEQEQRIHCLRMGRLMVENECNLCRTEPNTRRNYMLSRGDWHKHPCAWEVEHEGVSIEDSIASGGVVLDASTITAREATCKACDQLVKSLCKAIRKDRGCSACKEPWKIHHNTCPEDRW